MELTHNMAKLHSCFSSLFCFSSQQGRMAFAFLLFYSVSFSVSHMPKSLPKEMATDFGTLLIEKSDLSMLWSLLIKWKNLHWRLLEQAHEWALIVHVGWTHTVRHPTISPFNPLRRRSSTQVFNQSSCRPTRHKALASLLTQPWFTCQLNFHLCESSLIQMTVVQ